MQEKIFLSDIEFNVTSDEIDQAFSSVNYNKEYATPIKFIFTDSFGNKNRQRVPKDEFDNVLSTGVNMPIKAGEVLAGISKLEHDKSTPIGVITHLIKAGETVKGLGLLWKEERKDEVAFLKDCYDKKIPINLSWELGYHDSVVREDGVEDLLGVVVRATTIVGEPAYGGRTPILSIAQKQSENNMELEEKIKELEADLVKKDERIKALESEKAELEASNSELKAYKDGVEAKENRVKKLDELKAKFNEKGVTREDKYFEDNADMLLSFDEAQIEYLIQEAVSFKTETAEEKHKQEIKVPNLTNTQKPKVDTKKLGEELRRLNL